ncbi:PIN domain-containing protein [Candidatus Pacearchaeota archaeon]|nr:PIN domain-containing protein [Candidatus Pacearchaeota archaeon]
MKYFLDTYAIVEIIKGNPNYKHILTSEFSTSIFNLYELLYILLRDYNEEIAKKYYFQFYEFIIDIDDDYIFDASKFKLEHKKLNISYTDALGYIIALKNNIEFLTGDEDFKKFDNVEFVK